MTFICTIRRNWYSSLNTFTVSLLLVRSIASCKSRFSISLIVCYAKHGFIYQICFIQIYNLPFSLLMSPRWQSCNRFLIEGIFGSQMILEQKICTRSSYTFAYTHDLVCLKTRFKLQFQKWKRHANTSFSIRYCFSCYI